MPRTTVLSSIALLLACIAGPASTTEPVPAAAGPGLEPAQAIEVCRPRGHEAWLARLRCPDRSHAVFSRIASVGHRQPMPADMSPARSVALLENDMAFKPLPAGQADHHMVDAFRVACNGIETTLYLDMYHCDAPPPRLAPAGFELLD